MRAIEDKTREGETGTCHRRLLPAINPGDVFFFPEGVTGFEHIRGLSVNWGDDTQPFLFLKALIPEDLTFACIDPFLVCPDFEPTIVGSDLKRLGLTHSNQAVFLGIVTLHEDPALATVNLRAPVVLNRRRRIGRQLACGPAIYPLKYPIGHAVCGAYAGHALRKPPIEECANCSASGVCSFYADGACYCDTGKEG